MANIRTLSNLTTGFIECYSSKTANTNLTVTGSTGERYQDMDSEVFYVSCETQCKARLIDDLTDNCYLSKRQVREGRRAIGSYPSRQPVDPYYSNFPDVTFTNCAS